jgi:multisubunit Na+/H+ antiporter MnhG subunit
MNCRQPSDFLRTHAVLHNVIWYGLIIWFAAGLVALAVQAPYWQSIIESGIMVMLLAIPVRIMVIGESYRRRGVIGYLVVSWALVLLLIGTLAAKVLR